MCVPDINECVVGGQALCEQECINLPGSFQCSCYEGYEPHPGRSKRCRDINECDLDLPDCHSCTNLDGRYAIFAVSPALKSIFYILYIIIINILYIYQYLNQRREPFTGAQGYCPLENYKN